jgi:hypothetical protein
MVLKMIVFLVLVRLVKSTLVPYVEKVVHDKCMATTPLAERLGV